MPLLGLPSGQHRVHGLYSGSIARLQGDTFAESLEYKILRWCESMGSIGALSERPGEGPSHSPPFPFQGSALP